MDIRELTKGEKEKLLTGVGNWHTNDLGGKVESIHLSDGPHGLRAQGEDASSNNDSVLACCFPTASASACSFDPNLLQEMSEAIAEEAKVCGVSVVLGPGVNMKRNPLCGRNFEYFSEDPYLAGELATGFVKGLQDNGVAASLKHFAGNSQETHRMTSNSQIDERALREIYLRAFEKVVKKAKPATVMASYNLLNGKPACENEWLLTNVLRDAWGYEGLVMSDWGACVDLSACINAGLDLEMPDSRGNHKTDGITDEALNRASSNVLKLVENYKPKEQHPLCDVPKHLRVMHHELAKKVSLESAVLLKNDNVLPLNRPKQVVVIGDLAEKMRVQGGGSSHIRTDELPTVLSSFEKQGIETIFFKGYNSNKGSFEFTSADKKLLDETILGLRFMLLEHPDVPVLVFGGLTDKAEGEGYDRETDQLPLNQIRLYEAIKEVTENVIFVSFGGSPYDLAPIEYAKGILSMYLGGEGVAEACVDLLLGNANPCGRLAESWPLAMEDAPSYGRFGRQNEHPHDVCYNESLFIGYRYYDTFTVPVRYPFGYGLSYTTFSYSDLTAFWEKDETVVTLDVTNIGNETGKETVLIFVKNPEGDFIRANRELRGFAKVELAPGETKRVEIVLDDLAFQIYDVQKKEYVTVAGTYEIEVSRFVGEVIQKTVVKVNGVVPQSQREKLPSYFVKDETCKKDRGDVRFTDDDFAKLYDKEMTHLSLTRPGEFTTKNSLSQMAPYSKRARLLLKIGRLATRFITKAPLDDPESRMMLEGIAEGNIDSVCNQSGGIIKHEFIEKVVSSANRGNQ